MRRMQALILAGLVACVSLAAGGPAGRGAYATDPLEDAFLNPPLAAGPYVWWHWMGSNFSKDGITRDLEAMKASGIGGATIFNLTSAVQESHAPTLRNPWPSQTYRSPAYWDALHHAAAEADRLGLELGLHNTVGYSTTGGPWIDEPRSMQRLVWSQATVEGGRSRAVTLPVPPIPAFEGWGKTGRTLSYYRDIATLAVPADRSALAVTEVRDVSAGLLPSGLLNWDAPPGRWIVYRIGHASTGASPHPVPDELIGRTLEANKMSGVETTYHWNSVLSPLAEHLGPLLGQSFRHVLIDSYEAGPQNWTPGFREEFTRRKGYDPLPWLVTMGPVVTQGSAPSPARILESADLTARFEWDYRDVIAALYRERGWETARSMIHAAGLSLHFEPYEGPFDTVAGAALADLPMVEFWTHQESGVARVVVPAARAAARAIVGAEAFTGRPESSMWSETPAGLKHAADAAFAAGVNRMVLHHWVHQPFDDRYKPGMGMGWWGTHFGRNQTWAEPGKAFYRYLARVQSLLQRGQTPADVVSVGSGPPDADLIPPHVFLDGARVEHGRVVLPSGRTYQVIAVPHDGALQPEMVRRIDALLDQGATVVSPRPRRSPSFAGYPQCDEEVTRVAARLWDAAAAHAERRVGSGRLFNDLDSASSALDLTPPVQVIGGNADVRVHARQDGTAAIFFVAHLGSKPVRATVSFRVADLQPELWDAKAGTIELAPIWRRHAGRTEVDLALGSDASVFVVFRRQPMAGSDHLTAVAAPCEPTVTVDASGRLSLTARTRCRGTATFASGARVTFTTEPAVTRGVAGPWAVALAPASGAPIEVSLPRLASLSEQADPSVRYFAGTASYRTVVSLDHDALPSGDRYLLDLGDVRDLVRVGVNGRDLGVLWHPPFVRDVTDALRPGENTLALAVTNTWHNRLVGDEQLPADLEWGTDRGRTLGRALKAYPDWFLEGRPRPSEGRRTFATWSYHRAETPLLPAGLLGPVQLLRQNVRVLVPAR